jgi:hypothetical protein
MIRKLAVAAIACLAVTGCSYLGLSDNSKPTQANAASSAENLPAGLVRVPQSPLIGRPVASDGSKTTHMVGYVLADPNRQMSRYLAITSADPGRYILVPAESVTSNQFGLAINAPVDTLAALPHLSQSEIEQRFPVATTAMAPATQP